MWAKVQSDCFFYEELFCFESIVVDRHSFDAYPDPSFHFDAEPDPDLDPTPSLTHVGNFYTYIYSSASLPCFIFHVGIIGVIIMKKFSKSIRSLASHLVEMDTNSNPAK